VGDPYGSRVAASTALRLCVGYGWESDRIIVPLKPGNAGGGKGPDFWCVHFEAEGEVIGDESSNT
jgi:hypothetical protein